jgi:hypothetical protein
MSTTFLKAGKVYIFLHSWELNFILFLLGLVFSKELLILSAGLTIHLVIDSITKKKVVPYFLIYRSMKKFDAKLIHPELNSF